MPKKLFKRNFSKINNHIFCYDLETGNLDTEIADVLEIAGVVVDINTLEIKEDGQFGPVLVKPLNNDWKNVTEDALKKNGLIREEIEEKGLDQEVMFNQLTAFLKKFQKGEKIWDSLVSSGFNVVNYDNLIMRVMAKRYNYVDTDGSSKLFHPFHDFDVASIVRPWFFSTNTLETFSLPNVSKYFGLPVDKAHTALADSVNSAKILCRFLRFYNQLSPRYLTKFENCFGEKS